ncbi:aminopeptidase [Lysobacter sp. LF1]|uniref:Aminopeptidase n=1 Tax=Lysobacter stagni TaxID=3045172 RepID=A0ABT6XCR8_9GAMM|nr:aminopeptidase [Lysobacter sp. LF1]MDI9237723.1 aminopeptidase [Lysobacter sp. LF1]
MNRFPLAAGLSIALCVALAACQRPAEPSSTSASNAPATAAAPEAAPAAAPAPPAAKAPTDLEQLAQRLVTQSAGVREGETVLIMGRPSDAELLENIAVNVRKVGAFPLVTYSSDRMSKRMFFDVPAQYDAQSDAMALKLADIVDVVISLGNQSSENLFDGADPKRMAARAKADEPVGQAFLKHNVRTVEVGNNMYPTPWRAERYGMTPDELSSAFWNGVNLDYSQLQTRGEEVRKAIAAGNEIHITHPNGTDLKMRLQGRKVLVSDGIISDDDRKAGGPALAAYLPAGEVYTTPVPGTAEGKLVHTRSFYQGKPIDNLTLTVSGGKVTSMAGSGPGYDAFKAEYDAVDDARKDLVGFIDFGINPNVTLPAKSQVGNWMPAGAVTVGTGGNAWAGGENSMPYGIVVFLPGASVTLDGKPVVEAGQLKL